ncbi:MAG TPA: nuclear transport factor 2 family protein [Streptosporangiaceae bacterium]|nr:nuclear transport factor 2 family protein [Streptosporangiaceae bacterium]
MPPATVMPSWFNDALQGLLAGDVDACLKIYAPDAFHEFPVTREGGPRRLEGRDEIAAYMSQISGRLRFGTLTGIKVRESGDELIIEADGHHRRIEEGADVPFDVRYVWFITVRDGQVTHFTDYTWPVSQ